MERPEVAGALLRERLPLAIAQRMVGEPALVEGMFIDAERAAHSATGCIEWPFSEKGRPTSTA